MRASEAKAICTAAEYDLVRDAAAPRISSLTPSSLRGYVARARRLRDKYRDLANRQRREARGKSAPRGAAPSGRNENTLKKLKLFEQALARFQAKLDKVTNAAAGAKQKPVKKDKESKGRAAKSEAARSPEGAPATKKKVKPRAAVRSTASLLSAVGAAGASPSPRSVDTAGIVAARKTAFETKAKLSKPSRRANVLAGTANARIRGHAKGSFARAQAKRDAKNAKGD